MNNILGDGGNLHRNGLAGLILRYQNQEGMDAQTNAALRGQRQGDLCCA